MLSWRNTGTRGLPRQLLTDQGALVRASGVDLVIGPKEDVTVGLPVSTGSRVTEPPTFDPDPCNMVLLTLADAAVSTDRGG